MKKRTLSIITLTALIFTSCEEPVKDEQYIRIEKLPYKIEGQVYTKNGFKPAIYYTDTFSFKSDTVYYVNSDGTVVNIPKPYHINKNELYITNKK
jgi:hypothetical protein